MTQPFDSHNGHHRTVRLDDTTCKVCSQMAFDALVLHNAQPPIVVTYCRFCGVTTNRPAQAADLTHAKELEAYRHGYHTLAESA